MAKGDFWKEDSDDQLYVPPKSKRIAKTKKMEYDGWGSKPLIEFLHEIGKDTDKKISQQELTTIVNEYVSKNNLINPSKKKRVECDRWLHYLFGKKFVLRIKIYELLFPHLAENRDESSEDEDSANSEEDEIDRTASRKRKASVLGTKVAVSSKKVPETPKSCFASIIPENIKLVYLTRSLIQELLKDPVAFESKVVGSYVRIKSDPRDFSQKNSHQLLQVTGVRKDPEYGNVSTGYFLQVPHLMKEIPVSMLSNENFKTEECEDLLQRIKTGSSNRPTVTELQRKAHVLHEVITKQGIAKELSLLQNLIDRANEKGWRKELFDYLERRELLKKPAEQERLLREVPNVFAEELEPEAIVQEPAENEKNDVCGLPQLDIVGNRGDIPFDIEADKSLSNDDFCSTDTAGQRESETIVQKPAEDEKSNMRCSPESTFAGTWADITHDAILMESAEDERNRIFCSTQITIARTSADKPSDAEADNCLPNNNLCGASAADVGREGNRAYSNGATYIKETNGVFGVIKVEKLDINMEDKHAADVIELSDDDSEEEGLDDVESKIWYYSDPLGIVQGPFSMATLKK
ncbi:uncharacterized protein At5g08430-like isoform X2 [Apium graveolens]